MEHENSSFNEHEVLHDLKHYLPAQAPLKDFIHHNTLHAFQTLKFKDGVRNASEMFGYKISLSLEEFRANYAAKIIRKKNLEKIITESKGSDNLSQWMDNAINKTYDTGGFSRLGAIRSHWKNQYHINLDSLVHPIIFRVLCSYLDQGISIWHFPINKKGFLTTLRELEKNTYSSFFKTKRAKDMLVNTNLEMDDLLKILVGDESLYKQYIFDQQFSHQGWSGMVSTIENQPETLLDRRSITIKELIIFELLLEIDVLDHKFGEIWSPLSNKLEKKPLDIFAPVPATELNEVLYIWQEAFESSYYDGVLSGIKNAQSEIKTEGEKSFQAMFCIDDRECSMRRYLEKNDTHCETYGTPGFFSVEFYFQPEGGKFYTKLCPAPLTPKYLIKEKETKDKRHTEAHLSKRTHSLIFGWIISQTLGFWSALKLCMNIFRPTMDEAAACSFKQMDKFSLLTIENKDLSYRENNLQIGFTIEEMATRVENLLKSIGLIKNFAPIVYVIGHGSSSVNNPHYSAYDCGACSGRPGSVNARVICFMANHIEVRKILAQKGIEIPEETQFVGGLHDTTRDEIAFFDEISLSQKNLGAHRKNETIFEISLDSNAKERSRRLVSINSKLSAEKIHKKIRTRSVSLFEPRPELNHATNALCIVGSRNITKHLFLDRRSFLNSYDYKIDLEGKLLLGIMKPLGPVCGGINLEYFFSRVDNQKLGAGTKLPHNVMGLFGVANGIDGDLRPGLPLQMIEVHDPVRLLLIVEHFPEIVLKTIKSVPEMYEWFINEWVHLVSIHPETREFYMFKEGAFSLYHPIEQTIETVNDLTPILEAQEENLPVYLIK